MRARLDHRCECDLAVLALKRCKVSGRHESQCFHIHECMITNDNIKTSILCHASDGALEFGFWASLHYTSVVSSRLKGVCSEVRQQVYFRRSRTSNELRLPVELLMAGGRTSSSIIQSFFLLPSPPRRRSVQLSDHDPAIAGALSAMSATVMS